MSAGFRTVTYTLEDQFTAPTVDGDPFSGFDVSTASVPYLTFSPDTGGGGDRTNLVITSAPTSFTNSAIPPGQMKFEFWQPVPEVYPPPNDDVVKTSGNIYTASFVLTLPFATAPGNFGYLLSPWLAAAHVIDQTWTQDTATDGEQSASLNWWVRATGGGGYAQMASYIVSPSVIAPYPPYWMGVVNNGSGGWFAGIWNEKPTLSDAIVHGPDVYQNSGHAGGISDVQFNITFQGNTSSTNGHPMSGAQGTLTLDDFFLTGQYQVPLPPPPPPTGVPSQVAPGQRTIGLLKSRRAVGHSQ